MIEKEEPVNELSLYSIDELASRHLELEKESEKIFGNLMALKKEIIKRNYPKSENIQTTAVINSIKNHEESWEKYFNEMEEMNKRMDGSL